MGSNQVNGQGLVQGGLIGQNHPAYMTSALSAEKSASQLATNKKVNKRNTNNINNHLQLNHTIREKGKKQNEPQETKQNST